MKRPLVHLLCVAGTLVLAACVHLTPALAPQPKATPPVPPLPTWLRGWIMIDAHTHAAVGSVLDHDGSLIGTGVLITSTDVLTAAHVADRDAHWWETCGVRYCIDGTTLHPRGKVGDVYPVDAAVLHLSEPCTAHPVAVWSGGLERGEPLVVVGHGGALRKASLPGTFSYYGTLVEELFYLKMLCYEGTVWPGDSGGAVLNRRGELVGVISSFSVQPGRGYVLENSAVRVELLLPWLDLVMKRPTYSTP